MTSRNTGGDEALNDYRCQQGHVFAAPNAPHAGPWATLVCPDCGSTGTRYFGCDHVDDPTFDGRWCGMCNPAFGGDKGSS